MAAISPISTDHMTLFAMPVYDATVIFEDKELFKGKGAASLWAEKLAAEIAENAPLAIMATRATMREGLADAVKKQTDLELDLQSKLRLTEDFKEGVKAVSERRVPTFQGR